MQENVEDYEMIGLKDVMGEPIREGHIIQFKQSHEFGVVYWDGNEWRFSYRENYGRGEEGCILLEGEDYERFKSLGPMIHSHLIKEPEKIELGAIVLDVINERYTGEIGNAS